MSAPANVQCIALSKDYGRVRALDDLHLELRQGEILALLGPSGCGKTTTLRLIAGLERPDEGRVSVGGVTMADARTGVFVPPERRNVGMVFQDFALFPHLTAAQNVAFGLSRLHDREARTAQVMRMLALVGLGGLGGRLPHELSGGQQQRIALARALAPGPAVLLLDEPFSNLDARMRAVVREEVRDILVATGTTALFVTHDQQEALFMGDRVAVLNGGRLEQVGSAEEVFLRPASHFVADFMGHATFVRGVAARGGRAVDTALGRLEHAHDLPEGSVLQVLLRPDDLRLRAVGLDAGVAKIDPATSALAVVERRYFQGMSQLYRLRLASGERIKALGHHSLLLKPGDSVGVTLAPNHATCCFHDGRALPR